MLTELQKHFESRIKRLTINNSSPNHILVNMVKVYSSVIKYKYH